MIYIILYNLGSCYREYIPTLWRIFENFIPAWMQVCGRSINTVCLYEKQFSIIIHLALICCIFLNSFFCRTLADYCHNIELLDLSECNRITDISTESISHHCSKLASLNLESCSNITDNSLKYISDGCPVSWKLNNCRYGNILNKSINSSMLLG